MTLREIITTLYDALGLLALAFGVGGLLFVASGFAALAVAGVILLAGVRVMDWTDAPDQAPSWWRRMRKGGRT